jgi:hypothetical protein
MHAARTKQLTISLLIKKIRAAGTHIKQLTISLLIENMRTTSTHIKLLIIFFDNQENACIKHACKTTHHFFAIRNMRAASTHNKKLTISLIMQI